MEVALNLPPRTDRTGNAGGLVLIYGIIIPGHTPVDQTMFWPILAALASAVRTRFMRIKVGKVSDSNYAAFRLNIFRARIFPATIPCKEGMSIYEQFGTVLLDEVSYFFSEMIFYQDYKSKKNEPD